MSLADEILNAGDDQIASQYELVIPGGIPLGDISIPKLRLRMDQTFDPPGLDLETYEVWFRGKKVVRPSYKENSPKEFTINFRIDDNWLVYDSLKAWYDAIQQSGVSLFEDSVETAIDILLYSYTLNPIKAINHIFKYKNSIIKTLKKSELSHQSGEPLRVEAGFVFSSFEVV